MPRSTALRSSTDPVIWLGLAAAIIFFLATGAVAYFNFQTLKTDSALVVRSGDTLTALEDVLSTVKDAETGQRGYLLTGNESYLQPYSAAAQEIGPRLDALQRLTINNPTQQDRLGSLRQHIGAKLAELKQTIDLRQTQGQAAALAVVQTDRGKQDMDAVRDQVSAMEREEIDLRAKRLAEMADAYGRAIGSGMISSLLGIGLTGSHRFPDLSRRGRPTARRLASGGTRWALKGHAWGSADQGTWRQHSRIPLQISGRARGRTVHKGQSWHLPPGFDLWRSC